MYTHKILQLEMSAIIFNQLYTHRVFHVSVMYVQLSKEHLYAIDSPFTSSSHSIPPHFAFLLVKATN